MGETDVVRRQCLVWLCGLILASPVLAETLDERLVSENKKAGVKASPVSIIDDLAFIRRASVDLIGRIPSVEEQAEYHGWPAESRRQQLIDKLIASDRFADRWTAFFGDMLRMRGSAQGGPALTAFVHNAIKNDMPYDELARRLISTNGKANKTPEIGYVLGDNADPFALAAVTSQVFMGVRIGCAECHDHPFDVWTQEDFYGVAAYFGKTRRVESRLTRVVYTTETDTSVVLWPPEGTGDAAERKTVTPTFPFEMLDSKATPSFIDRLESLLAARMKKQQAVSQDDGPSIDDLLADTADKASKRARGLSGSGLGLPGAAKDSLRKIDIQGAIYRKSDLRAQLAELVTSPRNTYFAEAFVNRVWKELIGRGFVEPVDDFRGDNLPSHPETLRYIAQEFVANGHDIRHLVRMIMMSDTYQRNHAPLASSLAERVELENNFLATGIRRMLAESLYDSVVTAGHLFEHKYPDGANPRVVQDRVRVMVSAGEVEPEPAKGNLVALVSGDATGKAMTQQAAAGSGYALEDAIELDFDSLLTSDDEVNIEQMQVMSKEEIEAQRMAEERVNRRAGAKYEYRMVERRFDDNPKFNSSLRMASPAPAGHFLRVFGQTSRAELGEARNRLPSMRQSLMMLNGRLTNEAARVGPMEPIHKLVTGSKADLNKAVELAYLEILTRKPSEDEVKEGIAMIGDDPLQGMHDLRWVLLNCNEFRFLP